MTLAETAYQYPLLSLLLLLPSLGALLIWLIPGYRSERMTALFVTTAALLLSLMAVAGFDTKLTGFQFVEQYAWIPTLNIQYKVGIDGLSLLFLPLTAILFIGVIAGSWTSIRTMPKLYFSLLLLLESMTLGIFVALDNMLFFLFWELTLLPLYFLISMWGLGPNRRYAATKYFLMMLVAGVTLLFGILVAAFAYQSEQGGLMFDYVAMVQQTIPSDVQMLVFLLLLTGFAVKVPVFPFHTWLPILAMEGPVGIVAIMTGLKLGAYGLMRFAIPLAPDAAQELHWLLAGLGVVGILYGAVIALSQTNVRAMLAFSSMSHVGLVTLGIASFDVQGFQGAVFQLLNFSLVAGGLFLLAGFLHHRIGSLETVSLGGAARTMPLLASFFLILGLASMGVPGTSGFPAELMIFLSALNNHTGAGLAALFGMVLGAGYFLTLYRQVFNGPITSPVVEQAVDLRPRELAIAAAFSLLILIAGFYPSLVFDLTRGAAESWVALLKP